MTGVNKTLYIPLYGKAYVNDKNDILCDPKAAEIWQQVAFPLKGKAKSKYLCYYMAMRARVIDDLTAAALKELPHATVLHLGCGLDSRALRIHTQNAWYDVDFEEVIAERKKYYTADDRYTMLAADLQNPSFLQEVTGRDAVVVMEGVTMYLPPREMKNLLQALGDRFDNVVLIADFYTDFAAKMSRYKNPVNEVGVTTLFGTDDPKVLCDGTGFSVTKWVDMTPDELENRLQGIEKMIFKKLYGGSVSDKLYNLYVFNKAQ